MTDRCIHGFEAQRCATCRRCTHDTVESRCPICAPKTSRAAAQLLAKEPERPTEHHRGYDLVYVAQERSWYVQAEGASRSSTSYASAFLARRAVDRMLDQPEPAPAPRKKGK